MTVYFSLLKGMTMAIIIKPLTTVEIKNAIPKDSPLRDGEGLILEITNKSKKWRLEYRRPITKKRTSITLGDYPTYSLKEAREWRTECKNLLAQDIDPQYHRDQRKQQAHHNFGRNPCKQGYQA